MTVASAADELLLSDAPDGLTAAQRAGAATPAPDPDKTGWFAQRTDVSACLIPLLNALGAHFSETQIFEALPHFAEALDIDGLRNTLANLHFESTAVAIKLAEIDPRALPALYLPERGSAMVVLMRGEDDALVFDGGAGVTRRIDTESIAGTAYFFRRLSEEEVSDRSQYREWFAALVSRFRPLLTLGLSLTLLLNLISLAIPLLVMAVYDSVVATGSMTMLWHLSIGAALALAADFVLRTLRTRIVAYLGARIDNLVGKEMFRQILYLPPAYTERASISSQVARIKDFDGIRDFVAGPPALILLELPFAVVFLVAAAVLAGSVVFVPILAMVLFGLLFLLLHARVSRAVARTARAVAERQAFVIEAMANLRTLKYTNSGDLWLDRYKPYSASAARAGFETARLNALIAATAHFTMIAAGIGTVMVGATKVIDDDLTVGALIATMILVWRSLGPLQLAFVSLPRLAQVRAGIRQIDAMMRLPQERVRSDLVPPTPRVDGHIRFARVTFRYRADADPVLWNIDFTAEPGEIVALVGDNGSGKSTISKLLMALHQPQSGGILIDGKDLRQFDRLELRRLIGYVPQTPEFFYGTIAQNLRLANPAASDGDLRDAARMAKVLEDIEALPDSFETRIGDSRKNRLGSRVLQRLNLARCYLKDAPIIVLDEPGNGLDFEADRALMAALERMKGRKTVLLITHRPSHLRLADKVIFLENGRIARIDRNEAGAPPASERGAP